MENKDKKNIIKGAGENNLKGVALDVTEQLLINEYVEKLNSAFPNGISDIEYRIVLKLLYDDFCDRNLTEILSKFSCKPYCMVFNDIQGIRLQEFDDNELKRISLILKNYNVLE